MYVNQQTHVQTSMYRLVYTTYIHMYKTYLLFHTAFLFFKFSLEKLCCLNK